MSQVYKLAAVDPTTGEVQWLEDHVLMIGKKPYRIDRGYIKVFVTFLYDLIENDKIAGKSIRLLLYMLSSLDYNSYKITIIPKKAIEDLGITRQTFYEWINILIEEDIIEKIDRYTYQLKPYQAIKGHTSKVKGA